VIGGDEFLLMLVTRDPGVARRAAKAGIDRIFVDLEMRGKRERQLGRATVISGHTLEDVRSVRGAVPSTELLVRIDPPSAATRDEVDAVVEAGADVVMLPYFTAADQVARFVDAVRGRARACLLLETPAALARLDDVLEVDGVDELHVGLNDLHAGMGLTFMYELLGGGLLDHVASRIRRCGRPVRFGFGGGALIDARHPVAPADVLREHVRLGSRMIILSRTFTADAASVDELERRMDLAAEVRKIRDVLERARRRSPEEVEADRVRIRRAIADAATAMRARR
jgi:citrate lyase beta subunit